MAEQTGEKKGLFGMIKDFFVGETVSKIKRIAIAIVAIIFLILVGWIIILRWNVLSKSQQGFATTKYWFLEALTNLRKKKQAIDKDEQAALAEKKRLEDKIKKEAPIVNPVAPPQQVDNSAPLTEDEIMAKLKQKEKELLGGK